MSKLPKLLRPNSWSITTKLTFLLLIGSLLPMSLTMAYNLSRSKNILEQQGYRDLKLLASSTANHLDQVLTGAQSTVIHLSARPEIITFLAARTPAQRAASRRAMQQTLDSIQESNPTFALAFLSDRNSITRASTNAADLGEQLTSRLYLQKALAGEQYISSILIGTTTREPGIYFSAPVKNTQGEVLGAAVLKVSKDAVWDIIHDLKIGETGYAFLVDEFGIIIAHPDRELVYRSLAPLKPTILKQVAADRRIDSDEIGNLGQEKLARALLDAEAPHHTSYMYPPGQRKIIGFAPMKKQAWVIGVNETVKEFVAPFNQLRNANILTAFAVGGIVVLISLVIAKRDVNRVRTLVEAAKNLEQGNFDRVDRLAKSAQFEDDIGQLSRVFMGMASQVQEREADLKQEVSELRQARATVSKPSYLQKLQQLKTKAKRIRENAPH